MTSTKKSKIRSEIDEETPSKETLERWRDRKLKDDITNIMNRLEMESIKPSFDVLLQTGLHRGPYSHNFHRKGRPRKSKSLHEGIDKAGRGGKDRSHSHAAGKAGGPDNWYPGDKYSRPSTTHGDIEKRKMFDIEHDSGTRRMAELRDLSPTRYSSPVVDSMMKAGESLSAKVLRASQLATDELGDSSSWSSYATLPRSTSHRHYPSASIISAGELPQPHRGTYLVTQKIQTGGGDDATLPRSITTHRQYPVGASIISIDELPQPQRGTYFMVEKTQTSGDSDTLPLSTSYRQHSGVPVISVDELPQPQRGTYHVVTETGGGDDQAWISKYHLQSDGPHHYVRPLTVRVHDDPLMTYLRQAESAPSDFTLSAILAGPETSKHEHQRQQFVSTATPSRSEYPVDDEVGQLYRLLDNPFTGGEHERISPKHQITFSDDYSSLPYTPKTVITSPSLRYT